MMVVAWNNELIFQRLVEHHPFYGKDQHVEHLPPERNLMKNNVKDDVPNGQDFNSFLWGVKQRWGVKVRQQTKGGPCYIFLKFDKKKPTIWEIVSIETKLHGN